MGLVKDQTAHDPAGRSGARPRSQPDRRPRGAGGSGPSPAPPVPSRRLLPRRAVSGDREIGPPEQG